MMKTNVCMVAAALLLCACSGGDREAARERSVCLTRPEALSEETVKLYSGIVKEAHEISLGFKTAGQIARIHVAEGDRVRRGQLLAELDDADYRLGVEALQVQYDQVRDEVKRDPDFVAKRQADLCASLQATVIDILMGKLLRAATDLGVTQVAVAGGVSANSGLRQAFLDYGARYGWTGYVKNKLYSEYKWENAVQAENVDFRNCVMFNWGNSNGCYGGPGGGQINIVNNYYKGGPATPDSKANRVTQVSVGNEGNSTIEALQGLASRYYISGNTTETHGGKITHSRDWDGVDYDGETYTLDGERYTADPNAYYDAPHVTINGVSCVKIRMEEPCPTGEVTTHDAVTAFSKVLDYAGASLYRDDVDARYKREVTSGNPEYMGSVTGEEGLIQMVMACPMSGKSPTD